MNQIFSLFAILLMASACGVAPQDSGSRFPIIRTEISAQTPYFQFAGLIGNAPQTAFSPSYLPKSKTRNRPKMTRESAGALLYTKISNRKYVLIGKETSNGFWNFMRGSVETGDSFVKTAAKELFEETGGVYQVTEAVLLKESFDVYYKASSNNYACTFFVKLPHVSSSQMLDSAKAQNESRFKEMSQYAWIRLSDLKSALQNNTSTFSAQTDSGVTLQFNFYPYSFGILKQAYQKGILDQLN